MSRAKRSDKPFAGKITAPTPAWLSPLDADTPATESKVKLSEIHLPQQQPRRYFDPQALQELVVSVKQHGILQPLLVRPLASGGYELVAGERRYRAAKAANLTEVPVVVRELSDEAALQLALIENLQREDLNPVEETEGILQLLAFQLGQSVESIPSLLRQLFNQEFRSSTQTLITGEVATDNNVIINSDENTRSPTPLLKNQKAATDNNVIIAADDSPNSPSDTKSALERQVERVFTALGMMSWESFVTNRLPLLNLPQDILGALRSGQIAYTKAKAIARVKDEKSRKILLKAAIANNWSLSEIKVQIDALAPKTEPPPLQHRFETTIRQAKKASVWSDPKKQVRLESLLAELESLLAET
jgi:ParB family transcriptional regulator, chromosome partitioning protein